MSDKKMRKQLAEMALCEECERLDLEICDRQMEKMVDCAWGHFRLIDDSLEKIRAILKEC